ncbi:hypothetical protein F3Y22_tig00110503pilonHSYRG00763 [Hibiscus syriacus]|uniref:DUF4283 domain-containing protein n=1 Tax=Hibiscus syriacus TaxID=106335 RepID=A0A6A3AH32_HIBSY|nr:hypothetical protein F3Y22_tig00110503pilonHSYRG00763 [Hibiscus syriacus]
MTHLSLDDGEDGNLQVDPEDPNYEFNFQLCFVGTFLTSSIVNFNSIRATLANVWNPVEGIAIADLGNKIFLFRLFNTVDANRIEIGGPWNFNSHLLVLHRLQLGQDPSLVPSSLLDFWVLIHEVPFGYISEKIARSIGNFIGTFLEYVYSASSLGYKGIIRIIVRLDIRTPLKRRKKLLLASGQSHYVRFEYEKVTLFCFVCGILGHGESFCPIRVAHPDREIIMSWDSSLRATHRKSTPPFSPWLRDAPEINATILTFQERDLRQYPNIVQSYPLKNDVMIPTAGGDIVAACKSNSTMVTNPFAIPSPNGPRLVHNGGSDSNMVIGEEDNPLESNESSIHPRTQLSPPGFFVFAYWNGVPFVLSAGLDHQANRQQ